MDLKLRYRVAIALASLLVLLTLMQDSYAKYVTSASASTDMTIARWSILINNSDITSNNNFSNTITPIFPGNNYIASGIFAPTSEGYFDLVIDYSRVDVSFNKIISVAHNNTNTISDLIITEYSINGGTATPVNDTSVTINGSVLLSEAQRTEVIRFYVKWQDDNNENMDNEEDTQATVDGVASLLVNASFTQRAN